MADPVAWIMIESGWKVFDAEGEEIGTVHEVTGDENVDIFDGLVIKQGILSKDQYVPVGARRADPRGRGAPLADARTGRGARDLHGAAPEEQIIPEKSTWYQRFAWKWLTGRKR